MIKTALKSCKATLEDIPSRRSGEKPPARADERGFTAWQLAEQLGARAELWA